MSGESRTTVFCIEGMHCTSCGISIDWELEDLSGVSEANTSYAKATTEVVFDPTRVTEQQIIDVIGKAGFSARAT